MTTIYHNRLLRLTAGLFLFVLGALAFACVPAWSALDHSAVEKTFSLGSECDSGDAFNPAQITDIAVVESSELVYVVCQPGNFLAKRVIERFDYQGNPVDFTANQPYIEENKILEDPQAGISAPKIGAHIAVDNSSANHGYLFTAPGATDNVSIFKPSGEWAGEIAQPYGATGSLITDYVVDVAVDPNGFVYVIASLPGRRISKYNPAFHEVSRLYRTGQVYSEDANALAVVDSKGDIWVKHLIDVLPVLSKFEADQFSANTKLEVDASNSALEAVRAEPSPFYVDPLLEGGIGGMDVDPITSNLYVSFGGQIRIFSPGDADEFVHENAPPFGSAATALDVTSSHQVFAADETEVIRYGPGAVIPDVRTRRPDIDDVGHTGAVLRGRIELAGGGNITQCLLEYGPTTSYGSSAPCAPDPNSSPPGSNFSTDTDVSAAAAGLTTGATYHYRFRAANASGYNVGIDRTFVPAFVLGVKTLGADEIAEHEAQVHGSLNPDGIPTTFHFEYGVDTAYGQSTQELPAGEGLSATPVTQQLTKLPAGRTWHVRLVASNVNGTTYGPDQTFSTAAVPDIIGVRATDLTGTSATLHGRIRPGGYATTYRFEYGPTPEYGQSVPVPAGDAGSGLGSVDVSQKVSGLTPGVTYHFRLVATNKWGEGASGDTTFDFSPPSCPNEQVRQQSSSSYLPDCRAYEIVSPGNAGAVVFFPSQEAWDLAEGNFSKDGIWSINNGLAESPPRVTYFGGLGSVTGIDAPNAFFDVLLDMYMSTRTTGGWVTTLPGLAGAVAENTGMKECSDAMDVCIDHRDGGPDKKNELPEAAPYLAESDGLPLGQLPTNLSEVPGGKYFKGSQRLSGDGAHFVFSSSNVAFTPDGLTGGLGSAYLNDLSAKTVTLVSKMPNGTDILQDGAATGSIAFPGLSPAADHILMQTPAAGGGSHLYMRDVGAGLTYDVSRGQGVQLVGMTRNGATVYFVTDESLPEDTDAGADLYMWSEDGDVVTKVSKGAGAGDVDTCAAAWTTNCGIKALEPERLHPPNRPTVPYLDDPIAEVAGDIYLLSPELLDPEDPGIGNQKNLYVFHKGAIELVATLDPGTEINRIQISADGRHAAFLTRSQLTSYDNHGFREAYAYDAETGQIRCASCDPTGLAPSADVEVSQGGRFMSDDGRVFFSTKDSLDPRDANSPIVDVYEYVGGRPQLITSGVGARDYTGGSKVLNFATQPEYIGLEGVSRNGTDVFFTTFETLVTQDNNGAFVKIYDARTAGGFPPEVDLASCEAADECHGPESQAPTPPLIATAVSLAGGNTPTTRKAKRAKRASKAKRSKKKRHSGRRRAHAGTEGSR